MTGCVARFFAAEMIREWVSFVVCMVSARDDRRAARSAGSNDIRRCEMDDVVDAGLDANISVVSFFTRGRRLAIGLAKVSFAFRFFSGVGFVWDFGSGGLSCR